MIKKSNLEELIEFETDEITDSNIEKPILIVDGHNLAYRTVFSAINQNPLDNNEFFFWKHVFINSLLNTIKRFKPSKVIMTFDGYKNSNWRKKIYSDYKAHRKKDRDKSIIDFDNFYVALDEMIEDFKKIFTSFYTIHIDNCEADDIIAILVRKVFKLEPVIIVSSDKDMRQLLQFKNVRQFDATFNKFIECLNPKKELEIKILKGDFQSDHIPPIKKGVGEKTAIKILNNGLEEYLTEQGEEIRENYERNLKLISFEYIPEDIKTKILKQYNDIKISEIDGSALLSFFCKNKMVKNMEEWQSFEKYINVLT